MTKKYTLILILIISAGVAGFTALLLALYSGRISSFDDTVRFWFYDLRFSGLSAFVTKFTLLGNWQSITLICILLLIIKPFRIKFGIPLASGAVLSIIMIILMFGIGLSRIYCGLHYPSDVLAGWCIGISVAATEILIVRRNENHVVSDSSGSSIHTD